jgi:formate dehydrogenase iron-sulfur subunit
LPAAVTDLLPLAVKFSAVGAVLMGLAAVFCSVMVYVDTRREFWNLPATMSRFFGNSAVFAAWGALAAFAAEKSAFTLPALLVFAVVYLGKLGLEAANLRHAGERSWTSRKKSALLQLDALRPLLEARMAFAGLAIWVAAGAILANWWAPMLAAGLALLAAELCERALYFKAVVAYKMPGDIHAGSEHV